jgi:hypothetical protein
MHNVANENQLATIYRIENKNLVMLTLLTCIIDDPDIFLCEQSRLELFLTR